MLERRALAEGPAECLLGAYYSDSSEAEVGGGSSERHAHNGDDCETMESIFWDQSKGLEADCWPNTLSRSVNNAEQRQNTET
jgi:hypothetical protein